MSSTEPQNSDAMRAEDRERGKLPGGSWLILLAVVVALALGWLALAGRTTTVAVDEAPAPEEIRSRPALEKGAAGGAKGLGSRATRGDLSPVRFEGDVTRPIKISGPNPQYTEVARKARIQGVVIVEAIIDKSGSVVGVRVLRPLPMGLDAAAVEAVRQWKFQPATLEGQPVDVLYNLTVNFRLK
jgi:TonB family protein